MAMQTYIYCCKGKPYLYKGENGRYYLSEKKEKKEALNGKIVATFLLTKIEKMGLDSNKGLVFEGMYNKESCLTLTEIAKYVGDNYYYAWPIKELKILEEAKDILYSAPQSWCYIWTDEDHKSILISIKPKWVEKILNGEKTIEIRKTRPDL